MRRLPLASLPALPDAVGPPVDPRTVEVGIVDDTGRADAGRPDLHAAEAGLQDLIGFRPVADAEISERDRLQYFLDQQRRAVLAVVDGLDESQLHAPVLPSGWTPIGLILHLAGAEAAWFQRVVDGREPRVDWDDGIGDPPWDPQAPFVTDHASGAVIEHYRRQCEISDEILRSRDLDAPLLGEPGFDWPDEPITDVRWVVLHMIEETARHAGHLDAARELLDGVTGRGPR